MCFSAGLLSLLGALGANIPNYTALLTAAISGQPGVGIGILIGPNISNIAIILGISVFAVPARQGIVLARREARDAGLVGGLALAIMVCSALAVTALAWQAVLPRFVLLACALLTRGLFGVLVLQALARRASRRLTGGMLAWTRVICGAPS